MLPCCRAQNLAPYYNTGRWGDASQYDDPASHNAEFIALDSLNCLILLRLYTLWRVFHLYSNLNSEKSRVIGSLARLNFSSGKVVAKAYLDERPVQMIGGFLLLVRRARAHRARAVIVVCSLSDVMV